jgi:hypothetical protein
MLIAIRHLRQLVPYLKNTYKTRRF